MMSLVSSDILIGKRGAPITLIEGDFGDATNLAVRTMTDTRNTSGFQNVVQSEGGVVFVALDDGVYQTMQGYEIEPLSEAISSVTWNQVANAGVALGSCAYVNRFLFAPHCLIFDYRTRAWFKSSAMGDCLHQAEDRSVDQVITAEAGVNFHLWEYDPTESNTATNRCSGYTWKSAPLRDAQGRQIRIREVQVFARSFNASSTIAITVNGTTRTVTLAAGQQQVSELFSETSEVLDITISAASNASQVEAPAIDCVRIGSQSNHLLHFG
jgi:hypothetical protein